MMFFRLHKMADKVVKENRENELNEYNNCICCSKNINKRKGEDHALTKKSKLKAFGRISSCFPGTLKASMTVEASLVLPLFLYAFLNLISIIEIYRVQSNMSAAMHSTVKQMAVYGYEYKEVAGSDTGKASSLGLTYIYAANKVRAFLGNDYLSNSPIKGGAAGISWLRSEIMGEDECIDLVAAYVVEPAISIMGYDDIIMHNRMRTRAWTGYDVEEIADSDDTEIAEEIVYITSEGTVYHRSRACTYLQCSIITISKDMVGSERNKDGDIYYPCDSCGDNAKSTVYVTNYGNRYHSTIECNKLKRTVLCVPISEVGGRGACSKCG